MSKLARSAGLIGALTMISRISGLVREQLVTALLGATFWGDAYQVAYRIPNLLRDLFGEGALSSAFVPVFARALTQEGRARAHEVAHRTLGNLLVIVGVVVGLGLVFAPEVVGILGPGFTPDKAVATTGLTRVMMPFLLVVSVGALAMGMLNAEALYRAPASASTIFNVIAIAIGAGLYLLHVENGPAATGWAIGVLLGGLGGIAIQLPPLWRTGFRPRVRLDLGLHDPHVRQIALLMVPAVLGVAATNVNIAVSSSFASHVEGAQVWLNSAFRLLHLPIGVFGVAIGTISATNLARRVAEGDHEGLRRELADGVRLLSVFTLPATAGLVAIAEPTIRLIYEHGKFTAPSTLATADALSCYAVGLWAYSTIKVFAPAFYALGETRVPMLASLGSMAANVTACVLFYPHLGHRGLALAASLAAITNVAVLALVFRRRHGGLAGHGVGSTFVRAALAATVMGGAVWFLQDLLVRALGTAHTWQRLVPVVLPVAVGGALYVALLRLLRVEEATAVLGLMKRVARKIRRK